MRALFLSLLLLSPTAQAGDGLRGEVRGRVVDAASGAPLAGAVVVARWTTELPPNPAALLLAPIGGHGPGASLRTARVAEALTAGDGSFSFAAFTQEEQINQGSILFNGPIVFAFLPGYEPQYVERGEAKLYRYGAKPGRPATAENLRAFLYWLDNNIGDADGEGAGASMTLPTPGQRMAGESRRRELARSGQLTAMRTVREELGRIAPARPSTEAPGIGRIEVSAPAAPRSDAHGAGNSSPGPYLTPSTTPQADAERAFREGKRMLVSAPVCGYVPPPGCAGAAKYAEEYNRTLQELAKR